MLNKLTRFFHFTRAERIGSAMLLAVIALLAGTPALLRRLFPPPTSDHSALQRELAALSWSGPADTTILFEFDPNTADATTFRRLGLSEKLAHTIIRYREKGGTYRRPEDFRKMYGLSAENFERLRPYLRLREYEKRRPDRQFAGPRPSATPASLFRFNPNRATEAEWLQLGLPPFLATRIVHYREKGGAFRRPEDLQKIYGFPPALYRRLEPYIELPAPSGPTVAATMVHFQSKKNAPVAIDINQASLDDWQRLPGIGVARADRIMQYRERLGGFVRPEQVGELRSLPDSVYQRIRPYLHSEARTELRKIRINEATEETLRAHPYFSYRQATALIAYRAQHGRFATRSDLAAVLALRDAGWLEKIGPYLSFD